MLAPQDAAQRKMSISFHDTPEWNAISDLKSGKGSNISEEESQRRQSLFADAESQLTKIMSGGSSDEGGEETGGRPEEVFTDKARAATVVIGTKDIKEALDRKKAVEIFRRTPEARSAAIFFQQAKFLVHQGRYKEAVGLINKSVEVDSQRKEWLTERSYCYFKMLQPEIALKHIDEVIRVDPKYFQALLLKGEILFSMWDLERAMLCFVEGRRLRPDNVDCIKGVHKVRMDLEEISAYRASIAIPKRKTKFKRSKSAKDRIVSSPVKSLLSPKSSAGGQSKSSRRLTLDENSSTLSSDDEDIARIRSARQRKSEYNKLVLMRMPTSETKTSSETARSSLPRPKTAVGQRQRSSTLSPSRDRLKEEVPERRGSQQFLSVSPQSGSSLRLHAGKSSASDESLSDSFRKCISSSGEDSSSSIRQPEKVRRKKRRFRRREPIKPRPTSCIGPKVAASLEKDRTFLESILKNRGLRKANTPFTKKALRIAKDLHRFVKEREEYWSNRERFIRFSQQEAIFIP